MESHDDAVSARDKLGWLRASRVLLALPDTFDLEPLLHNRLDLVLLQREAARRKAELTLITRDPVVVEHCHDLGIACFPTIDASHHRLWQTARARFAENNLVESRRDNELESTAPKVEQELPDITNKFRVNLRQGFAALAIISIVCLALIACPSATVYLTPIRNHVAADTIVTADPDATQVDNAQGFVPARLLQERVNAFATVETSGSSDLPTQRAQGLILVTNLIDEQLTIPAGTIIGTIVSPPVQFTTVADATLPGKVGQTVAIKIQALVPGVEGNVPSNQIRVMLGPYGARVDVTNLQPTQGGDVESRRAISQSDRDRVRSLAVQQLQQRAFDKMQNDPIVNLLNTEFVPLESLSVQNIDTETYSGNVGEPGEKLSVEIEAVVHGIAIDERGARQLAYSELSSNVGPDFTLSPSTLVFERGPVTALDDERRVTFTVRASGETLANIHPADVQNIVRAKSIDSAKSILRRQLPLSATPQITTWPGFWPIMPILAARVQVVIEGGN